jgi:hypothetical protein
MGVTVRREPYVDPLEAEPAESEKGPTVMRIVLEKDQPAAPLSDSERGGVTVTFAPGQDEAEPGPPAASEVGPRTIVDVRGEEGRKADAEAAKAAEEAEKMREKEATANKARTSPAKTKRTAKSTAKAKTSTAKRSSSKKSTATRRTRKA